MNNDYNTLNRFNNEYLKCIVTTHASMIEALKDKGALIIYQSKEEDNTLRNHVYLGNEFLASGYGFTSKENLDAAESIIKSYNKTNEDINNKVNTVSKELNNIITKVDNKLENYTPDYIIHDSKGNDIKLDDIYFHGKPALYEDFEIIDTQIIVKYFDGEYENESEKIYKMLTINNINNINVIDLPLGSSIKDINFIMSYKKNDSAGINDLNIIYYDSELDYKDEKINYVTYSETQLDAKTETGKLHIQVKFSDDYVVTTSEKIPIIHNIQVTVKETPESKYKVYPDLDLSEKNYVIYSLENMVLEHNKIILDSIYIRGTAYLTYLFGTFGYDKYDEYKYSLSEIRNFMEETNVNNLNPVYNIKRGTGMINNTKYGDISDIYIEIDKLNYNTFTFFVSQSFDLYKVEFITIGSVDNWTGAVGVYKSELDTGELDYTPININFNGICNRLPTSLATKIYQVKLLDIDKPMTTLGMLHIQVVCTNDNFEQHDLVVYEENNLNLNEPELWMLVNNREFDQTHWLTHIKDTDKTQTISFENNTTITKYQYIIIKNKLNRTKTNY